MCSIRMKRVRGIALAAVRSAGAALVMVALAACGDSGATAPAEQASLVLRNDAGSAIQIVRFARCEDPEWGPNRLAAGETIAPGALRTWTITPGCWDLHAGTATHSGYWYDGEVGAGGALQFALQPLNGSGGSAPMLDVRAF